MVFPKILLFLFVVASLWGKNSEDNYKLIYPRFIPQNSNFEISLIANKKYPSADRLEIYILPERLNLNKIEFKSVYSNSRLNFTPSFLDALDVPAFKTEIDLTDTLLYPEDFFQVLFAFRSDNNLSASPKFYGVYKNKDRIIGYLSEQSEDNLIVSSLKFFKTQKNAGRALQIGKQSQFEISLQETSTQNLLTEFWVKLNDADVSILEITNKKITDFDLELSTNEFQMLSAYSKKDIEYISPYFISKKAWYHIAALFSGEKNKLYLYCNGVLFARVQLDAFIEPGDLVFKFAVDDQSKTYSIDLLRFVNFNNSIEISFNNRNYLNFQSDSSYVLTQMNFDSGEDYASNRKINVISNNLQFVKSDAPILARAPELNINLLSNSYELEWSGGDFKQAVSYVLEKSTSGSNYEPVFTIQADNSTEKSYSYLDEKDGLAEVVYYRVKQVNDDGTVAFSSQVKVGQGTLEQFILVQNYPNPFNPKTSIDVELLEDSDVQITIYSLEGREIEKLHKGFLSKGRYKFEFDAKDLPSGIYIYKVTTPSYSQTRKMVLAK